MAQYTSLSKMNPKTKQRWLKALRSGKYIQGQENLKAKHTATGLVTHCCLGVLCELEKIQTKVDEDRGITYFLDSMGFSSQGTLSDRLCSTLGLSMEDMDTLWKMNDGYACYSEVIKPKKFKSIANWIEKNITVKPTKKKAE